MGHCTHYSRHGAPSTNSNTNQVDKMAELDMENRDVNELNPHLKVAFEEVIGEPENVHSIDCVWMNSYCLFNNTLGCCYKVITVICALPLAFCWACGFACTACYHVWCLGPYIRCYEMNLGAVKRVLTACCAAVVAPCCDTCALFFSKINV